MTNRKLKKDLLEKLNVSRQALSQRIQRLKEQYPMSTEEGTYLDLFINWSFNRKI